MSKFTILRKSEIDLAHYTRAKELVEFWLLRDDATIDDLVAMVAESLQASHNNLVGILKAES